MIDVTRPDGSLPSGDGRSSIEMPTDVCQDVGNNQNGRWVRCEDAGQPCVIYGWIWVNRNCRYDLMSPDEIARQKAWVLFVGTRYARISARVICWIED